MPPKALGRWRPDAEAASCARCEKRFGLFRRRHHCRKCGDIFCARCSRERLFIPQISSRKLQRVCSECWLTDINPPSRTPSTSDVFFARASQVVSTRIGGLPPVSRPALVGESSLRRLGSTTHSTCTTAMQVEADEHRVAAAVQDGGPSGMRRASREGAPVADDGSALNHLPSNEERHEPVAVQASPNGQPHGPASAAAPLSDAPAGDCTAQGSFGPAAAASTASTASHHESAPSPALDRAGRGEEDEDDDGREEHAVRPCSTGGSPTTAAAPAAASGCSLSDIEDADLAWNDDDDAEVDINNREAPRQNGATATSAAAPVEPPPSTILPDSFFCLDDCDMPSVGEMLEEEERLLVAEGAVSVKPASETAGGKRRKNAESDWKSRFFRIENGDVLYGELGKQKPKGTIPLRSLTDCQIVDTGILRFDGCPQRAALNGGLHLYTCDKKLYKFAFVDSPHAAALFGNFLRRAMGIAAEPAKRRSADGVPIV